MDDTELRSLGHAEAEADCANLRTYPQPSTPAHRRPHTFPLSSTRSAAAFRSDADVNAPPVCHQRNEKDESCSTKESEMSRISDLHQVADQGVADLEAVISTLELSR